MVRTLGTALLVLLIPLSAQAEVAAFDALAVKGKPLMLKARTGGRFFGRGGELVDYYVGERHLGRTLSGGDGKAYMEHVPGRKGLFPLRVSSRGEEDSGLLLVLEEGDALVLVDVAGSLMSASFFGEPKEEAREAVETIAAKYPVLYLSKQVPGREVIETWLREKEYPEAPVMDWKGGRILSRIRKMGLGIRAVMGSAEVVERARKYDAELYLFDEKRGGKKWKDIADEL
jgi:hypothetical protein